MSKYSFQTSSGQGCRHFSESRIVKHDNASSRTHHYCWLEARDNKCFICLQLSMSNESVVVLRKVGFNLSGNFSCEVTVEAPSFSTATVHQQMLVVCKLYRPFAVLAFYDTT
jgi:hypothetical protein